MGRFDGKRILVTGATSGIGLAGVRRILQEGGEVLGTGRDIRKVAQENPALLDDVLWIQNDAADPAAAHALSRRVREGARLDGLWLNAGHAVIGDIRQIDADAFDAIMATNVRGPVLQLACLTDFLNDGASVVVTASTSVYEGAVMASLYAATKGALMSLVRCWASALGNRGIRVNALVPGPIDTPFRNFMPNEFRSRFESSVVSRLALSRIGTASEASNVALFLLSDEASFVTGSQYFVDGGLVKR